MWSAILPVAARGLRVGSAVEGKTFVTATTRTLVVGAASVARASVGRSHPHVARCVLQARGFAATTMINAPKTTTRARATKKPAAKKKKPVKKVKKVAAKKKKPVKKAKKVKKVKVVAKKKRVPKALAPEEKKKVQVRELKKVALLTEPAKLPDRPWVLYLTENATGVKSENGREGIQTLMRDLSRSFKELSSNELERLQITSTANRSANAAGYKAWVESHSPVDVAAANTARKHLNRLRTSRCRLIQDDRQPKRPLSPYLQYSKARWASGEFTGQPIQSVTKIVAADWKNLTASERQPYEEVAKNDTERYDKDVYSILGREVARG